MRRRLLTAIALSWCVVATLHAITFLSDTFTDSTSTALQAHTPTPTGGTWVDHPVFSSATDLIIGDHNDLGHPAGGQENVYYNDASPSGAEYDVETDFVYHSGTIGTYVVGVACRVDPTDWTAYLANFNGFDNDWNINKVVANSYTNLATTAASLSSGNTYNVRLECKNATKRLFLNDVEILTTNNNDVTAAGHAGLYWYAESGDGAASLHMDNFLAADIAAAGGSTCGNLLLLKAGC